MRYSNIKTEEISTPPKELNSDTIVPQNGMWYRITFLFAFLAATALAPHRMVAQIQAVHLSISNRYLAKAGSNIIISQILSDTLRNPTQFFSEDITYDKNVVEFIDVTNGARTPQPDWTISKTVTTPGNVRISAVSIGAPLADSGEILRLIFHIVDSALAFETTPFLDSAANFGSGTITISDTGMLHVYDECTPIVGHNNIPRSISTTGSPNPASTILAISYALPDAFNNVQIELFDALGACVGRQDCGPEAAGWHATSFDVADLPAGIYYYSVVRGNSALPHPIFVSH